MVPYVQLSTHCRIGFWCKEKICSTVIKLSSPQLIDNWTYGTTAFRCIEFPVVTNVAGCNFVEKLNAKFDYGTSELRFPNFYYHSFCFLISFSLEKGKSRTMNAG